MSTERNKHTSRRFFEEVWIQGNLDRVDELVSPDATFHDPVSGDRTGPREIKEFISMYRTAFPDLSFTIEEQIAEDDRVMTRWTSRGTHEGALMGIEPTGHRTTSSGVTIERYADGKIREARAQWDALGMMQDLGVIPRLEEMA